MGCGPEVAGSVYHPRQPQRTPFYQLVQRFYPQFEALSLERYQERYGFWRPIIGTVVGKFLECGDLKHGFARVRCPKCREEFFVAYSCRVRCRPRNGGSHPDLWSIGPLVNTLMIPGFAVKLILLENKFSDR
jgi:Transposase zinc-binding domain